MLLIRLRYEYPQKYDDRLTLTTYQYMRAVVLSCEYRAIMIIITNHFPVFKEKQSRCKPLNLESPYGASVMIYGNTKIVN
jgi:hypothetical protein